MIELSIAEYESIRSSPTRFPVKPGHDYPEFERVVDENEHYIVVEKFGEAGEIVKELDTARGADAFDALVPGQVPEKWTATKKTARPSSSGFVGRSPNNGPTVGPRRSSSACSTRWFTRRMEKTGRETYRGGPDNPPRMAYSGLKSAVCQSRALASCPGG